MLVCAFCGVIARFFGICALFQDLRTFRIKLLRSALLVETIDAALLVPVPAQLFV